MSLLFSDSLVGLIDEKSLEEEPDEEIIGKIQINGKTYDVDAFISDRKSVRLHAIGSSSDAISILNLRNDMEARLTLGSDVFSISGKISQIGYEKLPHGGRIVISMMSGDK